MASDRNLVWIDLEMTGLDPEICTIIEIATIITDSQLNIIAEGPNLVIHQSEEALAVMDEWNVKHHGESGLTEAVRNSKISLEEAERETLKFIRKHTAPRTAPLCGNSIWQDRRFLIKYMPKIEAHVHYRNIDVSSVKELARRWYAPELLAVEPVELAEGEQAAQAHRALDDIKASIAELKLYRERIFVKP